MLNQYICHKVVHAEPATLGQYNEMVEAWEELETNDFGYNVPDLTGLHSLDHQLEGYHVVYSKDTENEYHSWSPAEAFKNGYTLVQPEVAPEE